MRGACSRRGVCGDPGGERRGSRAWEDSRGLASVCRDLGVGGARMPSPGSPHRPSSGAKRETRAEGARASWEASGFAAYWPLRAAGASTRETLGSFSLFSRGGQRCGRWTRLLPPKTCEAQATSAPRAALGKHGACSWPPLCSGLPVPAPAPPPLSEVGSVGF